MDVSEACSHLSVHVREHVCERVRVCVCVYVSSIIMLPCPRHRRPTLLRGGALSALVSLGIIYHKGYHCIVSGCL